MTRLSISTAWDETKAIVARDGRLLVAVALALIVLPSALAGLIDPEGLLSPTPAPVLVKVAVIVAVLIGLAGQLALIRLSVAPSIAVGEAIVHGLKRLPLYVLSAILVGIAMIIAAIPFGLVLAAAGVPVEEKATALTPGLLVAAILYFALLCFIFIRMLMSAPVASIETAGPLRIIKRSWELTSGRWWLLFGFFLSYFIALAVIQLAVGAAVGAALITFVGPIDPLSTSALVLSLVQAAISAGLMILYAVMLARIYVQLSGDDVRASVPSSGT